MGDPPASKSLSTSQFAGFTLPVVIIHAAGHPASFWQPRRDVDEQAEDTNAR